MIPSFRLQEELLLAIINLPRPVGFTVSVYIISDNPAVTVPLSIQQLHEAKLIQLIINPHNLGAPGTRNVGIKAGSSKWILFLDDDINPNEDLLLVYAAAIDKQTDAIGFAGVTYFPAPFNAVTKAIEINGTISSFTDALRKTSLSWAPTANVMLNRLKMDKNLFDAALVNSEDVDFLTRSSIAFNEKYISLPEAVVHHPWWNKGKMQTARIASYGAGGMQIAKKEPIKNYTYRDFTNTGETLLLLILFSPLLYIAGKEKWIAFLAAALIIAELLTNWIKAIVLGKTWSPAVAFHLAWCKNCYEVSYLYTALSKGDINGFAQRIDMGFAKPHPSPFRTNRWKFIKMCILTVLLLITVITL